MRVEIYRTQHNIESFMNLINDFVKSYMAE